MGKIECNCNCFRNHNRIRNHVPIIAVFCSNHHYREKSWFHSACNNRKIEKKRVSEYSKVNRNDKY